MVGSQKLTQVLRSQVVETSVNQEQDLVVDSLLHRQPVQTEQNWCDVLMLPGPCDNASCKVLDFLQLMELPLG